ALLLEDGAYLAALLVRELLHLVLLAGALGQDVLALRLGGEEGAQPHGDGAAEQLGDAGKQDDVRGYVAAVDPGDDGEGRHQTVVGAEHQVAHRAPAGDVRRLGVCGAVVAGPQEEAGQSQGHVSATACHGSAGVTTARPASILSAGVETDSHFHPQCGGSDPGARAAGAELAARGGAARLRGRRLSAGGGPRRRGALSGRTRRAAA